MSATTDILRTEAINLLGLARYYIERDPGLRWRLIQLDPGIPGLIPVRLYIRVTTAEELQVWQKHIGGEVQVEPGPLDHQTKEYVDSPMFFHVFLTRDATAEEMADR